MASRLRDLVDALPLLQPQRRLALEHLGAGAVGAERIEGALLPQFVGREHGQQLARCDDVALLGLELGDAPGDLRADHDVIRGHDAGQGERGRRAAGVPPRADGEADDQQQSDRAQQAFHEQFKQVYQTRV